MVDWEPSNNNEYYSFEIVLKNLSSPDKVAMSVVVLILLGGRPTNYTSILAEELASKYKTKLVPELAREYGVSEATMHRWLKKGSFKRIII